AQVLSVLVKTADEKVAERIGQNIAYVEKLARAELKECGPDVLKPEGAYTSIKDRLEVYVMLSGLDVGAETERLKKDLKKIMADLDRTEKKLGNREFLARAPKEVVEKEKTRQAEMGAKLAKVQESLKQLERAGE
ncbi:hypothetical protein LCGC14_3140380, partial [marine sediment metagenome]